MIAPWVVGAGGLLGSAVRTALRGKIWLPAPARFPWTHPEDLETALAAAAAAFGRAVGEDPWTVLWCAGAGSVGTTPEEMGRETRALEFFLERLGEALRGRRGAFFLAGSAGGLHGGNRETPVTERSTPQPISDYGRAKLLQEQRLAAWAERHPAVSILVGRLSNLYGPGQNLSKPQGLIAHLSRCLLHHVPAHVYAPLDTIRDHLYVDDAAAQILRCMERLRTQPAGTRVVKILASGQTSSIAGILQAFARIARRQPRIICSGNALGRQQPTRLALRSEVWTDLPLPPPTPLVAGIQAVYRRHLELLQAGRLPAPAPLRT